MAGNDDFDFANFFSGELDPSKPLPGLSDEELLRRVSMRPSREKLLEISHHCIDRRAQLMDIPILTARSAAQIVVALFGDEEAGSYHGVPVPLHCKNRPRAWIEERTFEALEDLILEDSNAFRAGQAQAMPEEPRHSYLTEWFQVPAPKVLEAAVMFNNLPVNVRQSFYHVFIRRRPLNDDMPAYLGSADQVRTLAERGLRVIVEQTDRR